MSKLLINEAPLLVQPSLANAIGLNEAIFVQQLHYFCERSRHVFNGNQWVFNTYKQWCDVFPFWSEATIKRIISRLEKMDLVLSSSEFNQFKIDPQNGIESTMKSWQKLNNKYLIPDLVKMTQPNRSN